MIKRKKHKLLGALTVGVVLLLSLLWLQATESDPLKGSPDNRNGKLWIEPPDYHTYPAYAPTAMTVDFGITGLVTYNNSNGVALINPITKRISPIMLNQFNYTIDPDTGDPIGGALGSEGGGRFDVAMTSTAKLAIVSNFGDSKLYFVNLASGLPVVDAVVELPFFAEDIAIDPSNRWALVTDGGFSSSIAVIHIPTRTWIPAGVDPDTGDPAAFQLPQAIISDPLDPQYPGYGRYGNGVAIAADGRTVLVPDYFSCMVHVCLFDPQTGGLTFTQTVKLWKYGTVGPAPANLGYRPVNISVSPDGKTALVTNCVRSIEPYDHDLITYPNLPKEGANVAVLRIVSPGNVTRMPDVIMPWAVSGGQSIVFSRNGLKAYYAAIHYDLVGEYFEDPDQEIQVLSIQGPGQVTRTGAIRMQTYRGTSQLFGVDCMATSPDGNFLFVTNPTISGGQPIIEVVNLKLGQSIKQVTTPIDYPDPMRNWPDPPLPPDPGVPSDWLQYLIPCGISFPEGPIDLGLTMQVDKPNPVVGNTVTFTVTLNNYGVGVVSFNVQVLNGVLPAGLTWMSARASDGSYSQSTGIWTINRLRARTQQTLTIKALVNRKGTFTNSASIKAQSGYDPDKRNNSASKTIVVY